MESLRHLRRGQELRAHQLIGALPGVWYAMRVVETYAATSALVKLGPGPVDDFTAIAGTPGG